jgi:hypothetical protein
MKFCPFCGAKTIPGDQFCQECGARFDEVIPGSEPKEVPIQPQPEITNYSEPVIPQPEIPEYSEPVIQQPVNMKYAEPVIQQSGKFCQECGSKLKPEDIFCLECGSRADETEAMPVTPAPVVSKPEAGIKPTPVKNEKPQSSPAPKATAPLQKPVPKQSKIAASPEPPSIAQAQVLQPQVNTEKKHNKLWIVLAIIFVLAGVGAAAWFLVLNKSDKPESVDSTLVTNTAPVTVPKDTVTVKPDTTSKVVTGAKAVTEQPAKAEVPKKPVDKPKKAAKPDPTVVAAKEDTKKKSDFKVIKQPVVNSVVLYSNWNEQPVKNNPNSKTKIELTSTTVITKITTYQYNKGKGSLPAGTITLVDENRIVHGTWQCTAINGSDGTPGAKWVCEPNVLLPVGTYKVVNSGEDTWSYNSESDRKGFIIVEGYKK